MERTIIQKSAIVKQLTSYTLKAHLPAYLCRCINFHGSTQLKVECRFWFTVGLDKVLSLTAFLF